ncbi:MAG TPA: Ig-like domain-containing protein [Gemmatimonadales bacterium]|nr:Ig-like domain-containing protein [Gemmatimonadales bacterium]
MLVRRTVALFGLISLAALTGCGGGSVDAGDVLVVSQIEITPPDLSLVSGSSGQLEATARTSSGITVPNRSVSWSSDDPGIASVSTSGLVTAVAAGETQIVATVDGVHAGIAVTVTPKPVASVSIVPSQSALLVGETVDLIATPRDDNSQPLTGRAVSFSSDNPLIATVSGDGHVVAVAPGLTVVRATIEGKVGTANIAVSARPATQLDFQNEPVTGSAGTPLPAVRIEVQNDQGGNVTEGNVPVTISLGDNPTGAVLGGTTTVGTINGVAIFNNLTVNHVGIGYTLVASSGALTPAESAPFAIVAGEAAALSITTQPSATSKSGTLLQQQPVIQVRDAGGNAVAKSGVQVTAVLDGAGAALGGVRTVSTNAEGVATFTNLALTGPAGTYRLLFAAPSLTSVSSTGITIESGPPATIAIVQQPGATARAGVVLSPQPVVEIRDAEGNPVAQSNVAVSVAIQSGGGTLSGTVTALSDASGHASFTNLSIGGSAGVRTLRFATASLGQAISEGIAVGAGPASALAITTPPPSRSSSGSVLSPATVVRLVDAFGNAVDPNPEITITATLTSGPGTLTGTTSVQTINGSAAFGDLVLTGPSGDYTITFGATGFTSVSATTTVAPAADRLLLSTAPAANGSSGAALATQPRVQLANANGPVAGAGVQVTAVIASGPDGATLSGASATTDANGLATFSGLAINGLVGNYTLRFESSSLTPVTSGSIAIGPGAPAVVTLPTQPPQTAENGKKFSNSVVVRVQDAAGNNISNVAVSVSVASGAGTVSGTTTQTTGSNGRATFDDLVLAGLVGDYTLSFIATGGASVVSRSIALTAGPPSALAIQVQPAASATSGINFDPQPKIELRDAGGNLVSKKDVRIFAILETVTGVGTLLGTASIETGNDGVASFSGLRIVGTGTFRIRFISSGLTSVTSVVITVSLL